MPNDRAPFSSPGGVSGFKTLDECDAGMLSAGWKWSPESKWVSEVDASTDPDGWKYAVDFDSSEGSASKSMMHFVRWRKLSRGQFFSVSNLFESSPAGQRCMSCCSHGDIEEISRVAASLLPALSAASLKAHPKSLPDAKLNELKSTLLSKLLSLGVGGGGGGGGAPPSIPYSPDGLASRLDAFVNDCTPKGWASAMGSVLTLPNDAGPEFAARRSADVAAAFSSKERHAVAEAAVRW